MGECDPGLKCSQTLKVGKKHTAIEVGSGDVPVLATPQVLALAEAACVEAIKDDLPEGDTSVGSHAEIDHERATPIGASVTAEAVLIGHHGRRLEFNVLVKQDDEVVARVRHTRILVNRERFLGKLAEAKAGAA